ncbi:MAG TPA: hypothetical protein VH440_05025 [Candidatus Limnocylindrales bacterium]|jgi:hypothetical protein
MRRCIVGLAVLAVLEVLVAGCGSLVPTAARSRADGTDYTLHVLNGTTLAVNVLVNGAPIGLVAAGGAGEFPEARLPALPWHVEARTVSGRPLLGMDVVEGSVVDVRNADGSSMQSAPFGRTDLSCGRLDLYVGRTSPLGPAPGLGQPGDCVA